MAYVSYKNLPLYFGTSANSNAAPVATQALSKSVFCQQAQFNYTPNIQPTRLLGVEPSKEVFNLAGPPQASLSFTCLVDAGEFNPNNYTGDVGDIGATFILGDATNGIKASGAFLTSFSYSLTPYAPVTVQCDFAIYNPLTTTSFGGKISEAPAFGWELNQPDYSSYGHGAYSTFNGANVLSDMAVYESVQYQYAANRLPIYEIGSYSPDVVELVTEEHTLQIQGDNIEALVPLTGSAISQLDIDIKNADGTSLMRSLVKGTITAENISIGAGDLARGSITVNQILK